MTNIPPFIPEMQGEQFRRNMNVLRTAEESPETAGIFINTCGMIPGLKVLSDPKARQTAEETFRLFREAGKAEVRIVGDEENNAGVKILFKNAGRSTNNISVIRTEDKTTIRLGLEFDEAKLVSALLIAGQNINSLGSIIIDREGTIIQPVNICTDLDGKKINLAKLISLLTDTARPADIESLVRDSLVQIAGKEI